MSDDQDGCEWVSVSSGTDLPGFVPDQRLLNGCVCVCVCVCHVIQCGRLKSSAGWDVRLTMTRLVCTMACGPGT